MTYIRESSVERYFVRCAEDAGWIVRKLKWTGRRHAPDRVMMRRVAKLVFVELKAPKGVLKPGQAREHARLRVLGFEVVVLWSKGSVEEYFHANN